MDCKPPACATMGISAKLAPRRWGEDGGGDERGEGDDGY
jgi:hypothetical protein